MRKSLIGLVSLMIAMVFVWGCSSGEKNGQARSGESQDQAPAPGAGGNANSAGGLTWEKPSTWKVGLPQQMRVVTYVVSPAQGDIDNAELAVFHFPGTGGAKEANLQRWEGQFEQSDGRNSADVAVIKEMESNDLKVTTIELSGIYQSCRRADDGGQR